ncbi:hypothetical protein EJB05_55093, partial [Eragrostis curvula]
MALRKRTTKTKQSSKAASLLQLREQLDTAAKGTYVLGNDRHGEPARRASLGRHRAGERHGAVVRGDGERGELGAGDGERAEEEPPSSRRLVEELEEQVQSSKGMRSKTIRQERLLLLCKQEQCISYVPYETSLERSNDR